MDQDQKGRKSSSWSFLDREVTRARQGGAMRIFDGGSHPQQSMKQYNRPICITVTHFVFKFYFDGTRPWRATPILSGAPKWLHLYPANENNRNNSSLFWRFHLRPSPSLFVTSKVGAFRALIDFFGGGTPTNTRLHLFVYLDHLPLFQKQFRMVNAVRVAQRTRAPGSIPYGIWTRGPQERRRMESSKGADVLITA